MKRVVGKKEKQEKPRDAGAIAAKDNEKQRTSQVC